MRVQPSLAIGCEQVAIAHLGHRTPPGLAVANYQQSIPKILAAKNTMIAIALILLVATGIAHSYLGERYLLMRLFKRGDLPKLVGGTAFTQGTLRFAWHLTTVAWWCMAYLVYAAGYVGQAFVVNRVYHRRCFATV